MSRLSWCVAAVILAALVACNQTVGDCYPRGQGDGTIGAGAGVVTPGGVGASGEGPPEQPQGITYPESECNAEDGDSGDGGAGALDTWINCKGLNAVDCMIKCAQSGVACTGKEKHPYMPNVGYGDLYMCKTGWPTSTCSYYYSNGDECVFFKTPVGRFPLCVYVGGKP
jgi:hypothetical protein